MLTVVGIGADGWDGLPAASRDAVTAAEVVLGSARQLGLLPPEVVAERVRLPSPLAPALPGLLEGLAGRKVCALASGDPMFFGLGSTLVRLVGAVDVLPHPSSVSLACARLGWPLDEVEVVSAVGRPYALLQPAIAPGRRLLVLVPDAAGPAAVAALLTARGYGDSPLTVLARLGGPDEQRVDGTAGAWSRPARDDLAVVAVECRAGADVPPLPRSPGLPDDAFEHDGQLTKREVRAATLAALAPTPGALLWDVGAGAGSVAIEWMRTHPSCRAVAVEDRADRAGRITANATALGVPGLRVVRCTAPAALADLERPDAVFVGGGLTVTGLLEACWDALPPGGRLVANAVTVESEAVLARWYARRGGDLVRIAVSRAVPVGGFAGWRPLAPVTQWAVTRR